MSTPHVTTLERARPRAQQRATDDGLHEKFLRIGISSLLRSSPRAMQSSSLMGNSPHISCEFLLVSGNELSEPGSAGEF
jgi:hypothetical protein